MSCHGWRGGIVGLVLSVSLLTIYGGLIVTIYDKPGVYEDVPFEAYCEIDAVNNSRLGRAKESMAHYREPFRISTDALTFGQLGHTAVLEPLTIAERYAVADDWHLSTDNVTAKGVRTESKNTRYYRDKLAEFTAANAGKEIVTREQYDRMKGVCTAIDRDATARALFSEPGSPELTLVWEDDETGLLCKARIDRHNTHRGALVDLKTTRSVKGFPKSIANFGYHRQAAFYQAGWAALNGGELLPFWFVAVESEPPHCVSAAPMSEAAIEQGVREFRALLDQVAECRRTGEWPGPPAPDQWELPEWAVVNEPIELTIGGTAVSL